MEKPMKLTLKSPLDMHLHLRDGDMLKLVAPLSAAHFSGAIIMPNLIPPVKTKAEVIAYKERINTATGDKNFKPYMTLFFNDELNYDFLASVKDEITAIKIYPSGVTTNSEGGVKHVDTENLRSIFEAMSELEIPVCIHGETHGFVMDREAEFMPTYEDLAKNFPKLKIIMEHISTKAAVEMLDKYDNLYATVTLHHLLFTLDNVAGGMLDPHLFCKPIIKRPEDREALVGAVLNGHPKLMLGTDSAPHPTHAKEGEFCAAGVFSAPVTLPALATFFEEADKLDKMQDFVSGFAQTIYGITPPTKTIVLEKKPFVVPDQYGDVKPLFRGKTLEWSVV
jgi:dihydroorotase